MYNAFANLGRFSEPALLILSSLAGGPKHGYAMMADIKEFSGTKLEPGTLYGALTRLEQRGWIESLPVEERRRPYRITAEGLQGLRAQIAQMEQIVATSQHRIANVGRSI